jgi:uncharacterized damage-inducible protein DinB
MTRKEQLIQQLDAEAATTKKFIEVYPFDKNEYQIHPKSMKMGSLFSHILELPDWASMGLTTDELDFEKSAYVPMLFHNKKDAETYFENALIKAKKTILETPEEVFDQTWILRNGSLVLMTDTKENVVRHAHNQTVHHRAQLGVYYRILEIPVPASYGPSADNQ